MKKLTTRVLSAIIAGTMVLAMAGCSENKTVIYGKLVKEPAEIASLEASKSGENAEVQASIKAAKKTKLEFSSTNDMIIALETGKIQIAEMPEVCAEYLANKNTEYKVVVHDRSISFNMGMLKEKAELRDSINSAISELKTNGTLDALAVEYLDGYLDEQGKPTGKAEPTYTENPVIDGADTLTVAVTGDMAPLDYISADGNPAGFNVALMGKIGEKLGYNIKFISVAADARTAALASGKADIIFWFGMSGNSALASETLVFTDSYFSSYKSVVGKYATSEDLKNSLVDNVLSFHYTAK